jgi:hypothetical protein
VLVVEVEVHKMALMVQQEVVAQLEEERVALVLLLQILVVVAVVAITAETHLLAVVEVE